MKNYLGIENSLSLQKKRKITKDRIDYLHNWIEELRKNSYEQDFKNPYSQLSYLYQEMDAHIKLYLKIQTEMRKQQVYRNITSRVVDKRCILFSE